jgi:glycosyltransferase involved in cell wall biosynthesis
MRAAYPAGSQRHVWLQKCQCPRPRCDSQLFTPARRCQALRETWGVSEHDLVVLYVGRVAPEKNLGLAIAAYRAMQQGNKEVKFVIVGDGPPPLGLLKESFW